MTGPKNADISKNKERGASLVEYALLVALIAVVAMAAIRTLGTNIETKLTEVATEIGGN